LIVALPLTLLLLALAVGTAAGHSTKNRFSAAAISPNPAVVGAAVSFGVTYTGRNAPKSVSVVIDGVATAMTGSGSDYSHGVRFSATAKPAVGTHEIYFRAVDADGDGDSQKSEAVSLVIKPAAAPTPAPTRKPTPKPTPKPTAHPAITPAPSPARGPATSEPRTDGGATNPEPTSTAPGGVFTSPAPGSGGLAAGPGDQGTPTAPMANAVGPAGAVGDLTAYQLTKGASGRELPAAVVANLYRSRTASLDQLVTELLPTIATASAGAAAWAAFAFFGKRRRDDDETDDGLLAAAAGVGYEADAAPGLEAVDESLLPRWRRPSLQQVRRTDPLRAAEAAPSLSFESAGVRPLENFERRNIGYRLVRLLDSPDEFRSREIGILDQGDEVQLLQRHGVYWLILCPDGRQGWIHRMTLADPARAAMLQDELDPMPQYMDDVPEPEVEAYPEEPGSDGLLEAYMIARRDVLRTMAADESDAPEGSSDASATFAAFQGATFAAPVADVPAPVVEVAADPAPASPVPTVEPPSAESPAAEPGHAGEKYSAHRNAGSRKAATGSRPGTRSRRPSR
jgi:hypothetical protein